MLINLPEEYKDPFVIAEIGCNHQGNFENAKEMIKIAKEFCKVNSVKFQKRDNIYLANRNPKLYYNPHPNPFHSFGDTYLEHREKLEFTVEQHKELKNYCENLEVIYSTSVWDINSAKEIVEKVKPSMLKVPSASNNDMELLNFLANDFSGEIHISLGMTFKKEIDEIINLFSNKGRLKDLILYHCISGYPIDFKDVCLLEIAKLYKNYGNLIKGIGFSGHHKGIAIDIAAFVLGANYIERHFTLDRTLKGTDHAASLEPDGLRKLVRDLKNTKISLAYKNSELLDVEVFQREKLKPNIF